MDFVRSTYIEMNLSPALIWKKRRTKVFNWSEVHFYRSNFLQNPYSSLKLHNRNLPTLYIDEMIKSANSSVWDSFPQAAVYVQWTCLNLSRMKGSFYSFVYSPYSPVLDFWKIKLEKSSSMNWTFSLFRTGFLRPM